MRATNAKRLHNEDEVISKETGESIRVVGDPKVVQDAGQTFVHITGIGTMSGYCTWLHRDVR